MLQERPGDHKILAIASDFHLGVPNKEKSREREKRIIRWLGHIEDRLGVLILLGDIFDYWFEYKFVVPKGYVRFLGRLAELSDKGVQLIFFGGNHDMWMGSYFEEELGALVLRDPVSFTFQGKSYYMHHGDGLGPGDKLYKAVQKIFESKTLKGPYRNIHPDLSSRFAHFWSDSSRKINHENDLEFYGENEWLWAWAKEIERIKHHDFYVFGHRHLPMDLPVGNQGARYINTGEWLNYNSYLLADERQTNLHYFEQKEKIHLNHPIVSEQAC